MHLALRSLAVACCGALGAAALAAQPPLHSGDSLEPALLESQGIYMFDGLLATALMYGVQNMGQVSDAGLNLLGPHVDWNTGARPFRSAAKRALLDARQACKTLHETFAQRDCQKALAQGFSDYGRNASQAPFIRVAYKGVLHWNENSESLDMVNANPQAFGRSEGCMPNAICASAGVYNAQGSHNVLCLHLPPQYSDHIQAGPLPEPLARTLSGQYGNIMALGASMVFEVTKPVRALSQYRQCTNPWFKGDRLWAEGWITPRAMLFGDAQNAGFVATQLRFLPRP
ncbi:hypothetical protein DIC66_05085 [Rhodoferax lacus]|uniref:Uncharacterized protein n=1 Tax=Rhodoferax lacus TaxID=2184758 RepID=A0A3E1RFD6_9BURK|nr:hypothetical protein [Rhodoferax lacus]RFO98096.1 hypothetical protein DIC66_05085 [Rhodoferax lacus]